MQANLDAMARTIDASSRAGLASALHAVCTELRRNKVSWIHASVQNSMPLPKKNVQATFARWVSDARSLYRLETVRGDARGVVSVPDVTARDRSEDLGLVVVTVLVAASVPIPDVSTPDDAHQLDRLLCAFGALSAAQLYAMEVVWSPSAADDRMTPAECARIYPDLRLIRDETIAERIFCGYCLAPFSRASARCPRCGGPVGDARPAGT